MSIPAVRWVTKDVRGITTTERAVLYMLADMASERDGLQQAWPSAATISESIGISHRTAYRALNSLEKKGFLARGDQSLAGKIRSDRRPIVWCLKTP